MSSKFVFLFTITCIVTIIAACAALQASSAPDKAWVTVMPTIASAFTIAASFFTSRANALSGQRATLAPAATTVSSAIANYYRLLERYMQQGSLPAKEERLAAEEKVRTAEGSLYLLPQALSDHFHQTWQAFVYAIEECDERMKLAPGTDEGRVAVKEYWNQIAQDLGERLNALQAATRALFALE